MANVHLYRYVPNHLNVYLEVGECYINAFIIVQTGGCVQSLIIDFNGILTYLLFKLFCLYIIYLFVFIVYY